MPQLAVLLVAPFVSDALKGGQDETPVGEALGGIDGILVGRVEGAGVGVYVTSCTPAPATAAVPVQEELLVQPSRIMNVCNGVFAGTVYCTCAHTLPPDMHAAGGRLPVPVSSYTTSTPAAE